MPSGCGYGATSYKADISLYDTRFRKFWFAVMWVAILVFPFVTSSYNVHLVNLVALAIIGALALNLLTGMTGIISLGHAGFLCVGGFTAVIAGLEAGLPFWLVIPIAGIAGAIFGFIAGLPALRLKGIYIALSTLAIHYIITYLASEYQSGAHMGYVTGFNIPNAAFGSFEFTTSVQWYFLLVAIVTITAMFFINLHRSRFGRALQAIRDRDIAALSLGVNIGAYKLIVFMFSSAVTSMAGALSAYYLNYVAIEEYTLWLGILYIAMIVMGGMGSIMGSILGAAFVVLLPYGLSEFFNVLDVAPWLKSYAFAAQWCIYGLLIAVFLLLEPMGLVGIWLRIRSFFEMWPYKFKRTISSTK